MRNRVVFGLRLLTILRGAFRLRTRTRVGLLGWVSSQDESDLEPQIRSLQQYAIKRRWTVVTNVKAVGTCLQEGARQVLVDSVQRGEVDVVLVQRLECWGQPLAEFARTLREFVQSGVRFVSVDDYLDLGSFVGLFNCATVFGLAQVMECLRNAVLNNCAAQNNMNATSLRSNIQSYLQVSQNKLFQIPAMVGLVASLVLALWRDEWWTYALCLAMLIVIFYPVRRYLRFALTRTPITVLWLRRFQQGQLSRTALRFLELCLLPFGKVVTLSDSDITRSLFFPTLLRVLLIVLIPLMVVKTSLELPPFDKTYHFSPALGRWGLVAFWFCCLLASAGSMCIYRILKLKGPLRSLLTASIDNVSKIENISRRMGLHGLDRLNLLGSSTIFKCPASDCHLWKEAIRALVPYCDLVFVDGSEFTENTEWELQTVLSVCSAERILLVMPEECGGDGAKFGESVKRTLDHFFGERRPTILFYPRHLSWIRLPGTMPRAVNAAIATIAATLAAERTT